VSGDTLAEAAALLWPAPAQVSVVAGRRSASAGRASGSLAYALLPGVADPRLAVPLRPRAAAAAVAKSQAAANSWKAAARNRLMAAAFRTGLAGVLVPGRLTVLRAAGVDAGLDTALAGVLGQDVCLGIRVGPPRANRKPVLQVVSPDGRLLGYAKLGINTLTDRLVRAESAALTQLAGAALGEVQVPDVLHVGTWQGHPLLVQAPLPVRRAGNPGGRRLVDAMVAVARSGAGAATEPVNLP
jgi:hypothetical protein